VGIALDQVVAPVAEVEQFEEPAGLRQDLVGGMVKVKAGDEAQVFVAGQLFVEEGAIGDIAGAPFASSGARARSWPQMVTVPADGCSRPASILMVVVLPAPLGPRKP